MSAMPGPWSCASICNPMRPASPRGVRISPPPLACLTRFEANSVATRASSSLSACVNPCACAISRAVFCARKASAICVTARSWGSVPMSGFALPLSHRDGGALADHTLDVHFVHQPFGTGETHAQSAACRITLLHGLFEIYDSRTTVFELQLEARRFPVPNGAPLHHARAGIFENVAGQFGSCGHDACSVCHAEAEMGSGFADGAPRGHDIAFGIELQLACDW